MRIYTRAGDLAFKTLTFPDGQPHFQLETYEREYEEVTVETALKSPTDLFLLMLVSSVLRNAGYSILNLDIRYLLGARMDRAINWSQPFTLDVVARLINGLGFSRIRILDAHSEVATRLIRNSINVLPRAIVRQVEETLGKGTFIPVAPDKGATERVAALFSHHYIGQCSKTRDITTGNLSGFKVHDAKFVRDHKLLIVDDICDGGGTFVGLAKELRACGAKEVNLFVTHGIFSKGLPLDGINHIFYTDSYEVWTAYCRDGSTRIPISMKDLV